ncbi:MAG TPA: UDP-N-acetylmuramoyl-L-alanine--D-glutamate ligase [Rhodanobacteraceae bacterium]|nr:UDP-N-acetylmuramoyl-L-alanine--D-glutamate ligase [Rhodanobacteraceae bacterium]
MRIADLAGRRVAIWGYGREGRAALAALRARLPRSNLTVFCNASEAAAIFASNGTGDGLPPDPGKDHGDRRGSGDDGERNDGESRTIAVTVPPDAAALSAFDVVVKSPGISAYRPEIIEAQHNGTLFASGTALWFAEHPEARVVAVTGTKGKSTVTALIAHGLRALGKRTALAGNIGLPLLELLDPPVPPDWWAIELSSFQTRAAPRADIGVVNNVHEEHLDWHGTRERYAADKLALAGISRVLVVNALQPELMARTAAHRDRRTFGGSSGWHVHDRALHRAGRRALALAELPLPGLHNALNVCAALTAIEAAGCDAFDVLPHLCTFRALPHRLQVLGERDGVTFIDDSIATTPQATLEALASIGNRRTTVLVGGHERGLDWRAFADAVHRQPPHAIVAMGANGPRIADVLGGTGGAYRLESAHALDDAVAIARRVTPKGGVILLSPGAPSFDQFRDYAERGAAFARLGGFDTALFGEIAGLGIA